MSPKALKFINKFNPFKAAEILKIDLIFSIILYQEIIFLYYVKNGFFSIYREKMIQLYSYTNYILFV